LAYTINGYFLEGNRHKKVKFMLCIAFRRHASHPTLVARDRDRIAGARRNGVTTKGDTRM